MDLIKWDSLLDASASFEGMPDMSMTGWDLATDVYVEDGTIAVDMQLPGIQPDTYEIKLEDGSLVVTGARSKETETQDQDYYRKEIRRGNFERRVSLPEGNYDTTNMTSSTENGMLKVRIPKQ